MPRCARAAAAAAALASVSVSASASSLEHVQLDPATGLFRDEQGRTRVFHGMNVVFKESPWYPPSESFNPSDSLDEETLKLMRKWGFNVVRLGVMWPGVEPSKGSIDHSYLKEVDRLSKVMGTHGIYTLVDLHQDIGSRRFCGEGFPEYYVDALEDNSSSAFSKASTFPSPQNFPMAVNATGAPPLSECLKHGFATYYLTDRVGAMWNELYRPGSDLQQGFLRYWDAVSKTFAQQPQVLGYELLNEPSGYCLEPGKLSCLDTAKVVAGNEVEAKHLTPMYQAAAQIIRSVDKETPIFYEPTILPKPFADAFPAPALENDPQQGLAYHIYCQPGDGDGFVQGLVCDAVQDLFAKLYYGFLHKHKVGGFMTEFGAVGGNKKELEHLQRLLTFADNEFQSWAYWMLKKYKDFTTANAEESLYDENGKLETAKLATLSRTYAQAIGGAPKRMKFNAATGAFMLSFNATVTSAPTEIYLNEELNYPDGHTVEVSPAECLTQQQSETNYLHFSLADGAPCMGKDVTIRIQRKPAQAVELESLVV